MNLIEQFLRKVSYKFPKGYPDINDPKDWLMLEGMLKGMGIKLYEGVLNWGDLSSASRKYYRLGVIDDKIKQGSPFTLADKTTEEKLQYTDESYSELFANQKVEDIKKIGGTRINKFPFFKTSSGKEIGFNGLFKTKELGGTGGSKAETTERQERGLVDLINSTEGSKTIISKNGYKIPNVAKAGKFEGQSSTGTEPYSDIILYLEDGTELLVSAKGPSAPSLGGGGIVGIRALTKEGNNPELLEFIKNFYNKAYQFYKDIAKKEGLEGENLYKNKLFPDVSVKVPDSLITTLVRGTKDMGGPVDLYYIGSMDVEGTTQGNTVNITNGSFIPITDFIEQKGSKLYAHIRKRDGDIYLTDKTKDLNGVTLPLIFSNSPKGKGTQSRFGMIDKIRGVDIT